MAVPFVDLKAQYRLIQNEIEESAIRVLRSGDYVAGHETQAFEEEFAHYCGARYAIGAGNGTDALRIALEALGAGPGKEVITPAHTFVATAEAVVHTGATPVFVDVERETGNLDPSLLAGAISDRTCAIVAVHLYGRPADMDSINAVARARSIPVVEDAAQAQGARYKGRSAGSLGDIACFSFYPSKNLGAAGDAGAITTNSEELAKSVRLIGNHGCSTKYMHDVMGGNSRLDSIQAAVLRVKLRHLNDWNARRRAIASEYRRMLRNLRSVVLPAADGDDYQGVHHLFAVRVEHRERLRLGLIDHGVIAAVHYPIGVHRQAAFSKYRSSTGPLPQTEDWADHELSLPMFETMTAAQVSIVCEAIDELSAVMTA